MIAQLYSAAFQYAAVNSPWLAMFVFSFISSFAAFLPVFAISYWYRKRGKELKLGTQLLIYLTLVFVGWLLLLFIESLSIGYLFAIWKLALIGLGVYLVAWYVYNAVINKWPSLPWMLVQFGVIWLVSLVIWYYLLFIAQIFGNLSVVYVI